MENTEHVASAAQLSGPMRPGKESVSIAGRSTSSVAANGADRHNNSHQEMMCQ
jgi:hypothetical protein